MKIKRLPILFVVGLSLGLVISWFLIDLPRPVRAEPTACVAGPHNGTISSDQQWCLADSPHHVNGSMTINPGVTLTIDPGVTVIFDGWYYLTVNGTLIATGNTDHWIYFTSISGSPQPGDWGGFNINAGSALIMSYCDVGYGGHTNYGFYIRTSDSLIDTCHIHHMQGDAIVTDFTGLSPTFANLEIDYNTWRPLRQTGISQHPALVNLNFHDNGTDALWIDGSSVIEDTTLDGSPLALNGAPVYLFGTNINSPHTLTVTPGTTIKMGAGQTLNVTSGATLIAEGTAELPITFTSQSESPQPGDWGKLNDDLTGTLHLRYCDVGYGGSGPSHELIYSSSPNVEIRNCRIHHSLGQGVWFNGTNLTPILEHVEIDHNSTIPLHQAQISMTPTYLDLSFHDNGTDALVIDGSGVIINLTLDGSPSSLNGAPIYLSGTNINSPNTLTVTPGTTIKMGAGQSLNIIAGATLVAEGTADLPITFTSQSASPQPGDWGKINADLSAVLRLNYCDVGFGGNTASHELIYSSSPDVQIRNCRIHHSLEQGVWFNGLNLAPILEHVEIDHNASIPLHQSQISMTPTYLDLSLHDNGTNALFIDGSGVIIDVVLDGSPTALNGAPIYYGGGTINSGYTVTVTPGTTLKMASGSGFNVAGNAYLVAEGTTELPITFTAQTANPQPGDWGTINTNGGAHVSMSYCDVGYGGGTPGNRIFYIVTTDVQIRHCRIHDSLKHGVIIEGTGHTSVFEDLEIDHNLEWPINQNQISNNITYTNIRFHDNGWGGLGIGASDVAQDVTLDGSPAAFNGASIYYGGGGVQNGHTLTITPGTTLKIVSTAGFTVYGGATLLADGAPGLPIVFTGQSTDPQPGDWQQLHIGATSSVRLSYCEIAFSGAGGGTRAVWLSTSDVVMRNCLIHDSLGDGLFLDGNIHPTLENVAIIDSGGSGLSIMNGSTLTGLHLTLARAATGVYLAASSSIDLTNTIIAQNDVGINVIAGATANLAQTLWSINDTDVIGTINETGHIDGPAGFDLDGYHLTRYSAGLAKGIDTGLLDDIDGDLRPLPTGTAPDLGADEFPYRLGEDFAAEKIAFDPQWVVAFDPGSGEGYGSLRQQYLLRYYYGSPVPNPPDLSVSVTDALPAELDFEYELHNPTMDFTQNGKNLTWETSAPVAVGQSGEILLSSLFMQPEPGLTLINQAVVNAGSYHFDLQATTQVPLFPPLITSPGNGEICPDPSGNAQVQGTAQAGVILHVYENGIEVGTTTPSADGTFTLSYPSLHVGIDPTTTITVQACAPSNPDYCSNLSEPLTLTESQSFWCPQRSNWSDIVNGKPVVFHFKDRSGWFSTQDWVVSGIYGFYDTDLILYACDCPAWTGTTEPPSSLWAVVDNVTYYPTGSFPWYDFAITGGSHEAEFWAQCGSTNISSEGVILVDPDGFVFDVTKGFDPDNPSLYAIPGVTVTAYVSMTEWGGWVPWPAHLYDNQINPQVTGDDGYFAFFTPPGQYYLQVDGVDGYQPWRSPVIDVITQVVHANVPYTPWTDDTVSRIMLTLEGPDIPVINITVGNSIEWCVPLDGLMTPERLIQLYTNPVLRPLSDKSPINYESAWDGGMMAPGQCYLRQFNQLGTFTYTDSLGHSGVVVVNAQAGEYRINLPIIRK